MLIQNNFLGSVILCTGFFSMIFFIELWARKKNPSPELSRKAVHFTGGIGCVFFPFFVSSPYAVGIMALIFSLFFLFSGKYNLLKSLGSIERKSRGSEYYPISVFIVYYISWANDKIWLYISTILILAVSDAAAALIGGEYGKLKYKAGSSGNQKSVEGSVFFLILTYLSIQITLILMTDLPKEVSVLAPFLIALLLTGVEAVSDKGRDNIFVPVFTCYGLLKITEKSVNEVAFQCLSLIAIIIVLVILFRSMKLFTISASILFIIATYGVWSLGSADWAIVIFTPFLLFYINRNNKKNEFGNQQVEIECLVKILAAPVVILVAANAFDLYEKLFAPFVVSTACAYVCIEWSFFINAYNIKDRHRPFIKFLAAIIPGILILTAVSVSQWVFPLKASLMILLIIIFCLFSFDLYLKNNKKRILMLNRGYSVMFLSLFAGLICFAAQYYFILDFWKPLY